MQELKLDWRTVNEVGHKYDMLTVISASSLRSGLKDRVQRWLCRCDCGNEVIVRGTDLRDGSATNCGCESNRRIGIGQASDITGKQFGRLTAICNTWKSNERGFIWECLCECGNHCFYPVKLLTSHNVNNCGCVRRPKTEQELIDRYYHDYKYKAQKRDIKFELSIDEFSLLIKGACVYCGGVPVMSKKGKKGYALVCNGIDRVDNSMGYIISNCVSSCGNCNHMKFTLSKESFLEHIKKVYFFQLFKNKS